MILLGLECARGMRMFGVPVALVARKLYQRGGKSFCMTYIYAWAQTITRTLR